MAYLKSCSLDLNPCVSDFRVHDTLPTYPHLLKSNQVFIHPSRILLHPSQESGMGHKVKEPKSW